MVLGRWMRIAGLSDRQMAEKVGGISISGIRKLRYRERGPSIQVAARIAEISAGKVTFADMLPLKSRSASPSGSTEGAGP